jgi:hypothetical protein
VRHLRHAGDAENKEMIVPDATSVNSVVVPRATNVNARRRILMVGGDFVLC